MEHWGIWVEYQDSTHNDWLTFIPGRSRYDCERVIQQSPRASDIVRCIARKVSSGIEYEGYQRRLYNPIIRMAMMSAFPYYLIQQLESKK